MEVDETIERMNERKASRIEFRNGMSASMKTFLRDSDQFY